MSVNDGIATFTFEGNGHNTFPTWKMVEVAEILENLNTQEVRAVILTAGENRSFGVGGDFKEVKTFKGSDEVDEWIAVSSVCRLSRGLIESGSSNARTEAGDCLRTGLLPALRTHSTSHCQSDDNGVQALFGAVCV